MEGTQHGQHIRPDPRLPHRLALTALVALPLAPAAEAQPATVHKTTLQDRPFPPPRYHTATVRTVVDPRGEVAPHTHPGIEMGYVLEGRAVLTLRGQPPRPLSAGDSFAVPPADGAQRRERWALGR